MKWNVAVIALALLSLLFAFGVYREARAQVNNPPTVVTTLESGAILMSGVTMTFTSTGVCWTINGTNNWLMF